MRFDNIDLTGKTSGRLTASSRAENRPDVPLALRMHLWQRIVASTSNDKVKLLEAAPAYKKNRRESSSTAWRGKLAETFARIPYRGAMRYRCNNPNCSDHQYYGGRVYGKSAMEHLPELP